MDNITTDTNEVLTTKEGVITIMKNSKTAEEWNGNCDKVKKANNGYPDWWYTEIVIGGVLNQSKAENNW